MIDDVDLSKKLVGTYDARVWAALFVATVLEHPSIATDEGTMIAWFASAIETGAYSGREHPPAEEKAQPTGILGAHPSLVVVDEHVDFSTVVGDEPICPDCRDDKHKACVGSAWDDTHDAPAVCDCWERWPEIHQP
jgi:hypothetical protein